MFVEDGDASIVLPRPTDADDVGAGGALGTSDVAGAGGAAATAVTPPTPPTPTDVVDGPEPPPSGTSPTTTPDASPAGPVPPVNTPDSGTSPVPTEVPDAASSSPVADASSSPEDAATPVQDADLPPPDVVAPCADDADDDGICTPDDNCPNVANAEQANRDGDEAGDACDECPDEPALTERGLCQCEGADIDDDGVCDAIDLELATTVPDYFLPVVSQDERTLFALRTDRDAIIALDISAPESPTFISEYTLPTAEHVIVLHLLADGRLASISGPDGTLDEGRLRVFSFDGSSLSVDEDITTTSDRLYDLAFDPSSDRLYWSDFSFESVHYYTLGDVDIGHSGLGTSLGTFAEQGTFGLYLDGGYLYRLRSILDVVDIDTGTVVNTVALDGSHAATAYQNVTKVGDYLIYVDAWFTPIDITAVDVSDPEMATTTASLQISNTLDPTRISFDVREPASVAVVADRASGLHVLGLAELPTAFQRHALLEPADLGGLTPNGTIDCSEQCCYADTVTGEVMVLCP